jgi:hypothetical protein
VTRVKLILEGQTERAFIVDVLAPYIDDRTEGQVVLVPSVLITAVGARSFRGGTGHDYGIVKRNALRALDEGGADWVSSMLDVFRFPSKGRPWSVAPKPADPLEWVKQLEQQFARDVGDRRFRPYLCLHEFEALLFSSPQAIADVVEALRPHLDELRSLVAAMGSPEHINDGPDTAPAKRLTIWAGNAYRKPLHGVAICRAIGVDAMRKQCKHFDEWVQWLLAPSP